MRGIGGSERHLLALLPALAERGVDVVFVGLDDPDYDSEPFYRTLPVPAVRIPAPRDLDPLLPVRVARRLRADVVHTHLVHADVYGAAAAVLRHARLVSTKHNDDPFRTGPFRHVERAIARRAEHVIAITEALRRFTVEQVGIPAAKVTTIHYGLDEPPAAWGENPSAQVASEAVVLLAVARLTAQKGLDVAVRALPVIRETEPRAELVVLGEGPDRGALERLAARLGVADAVHLLGRVPDVAAWLRRADVLVHPARWEGFGLALLEAMLTSLPVVATRISAIPEIVVDDETGLLVPPDDAPALAAAVVRALANGDRLGAAGLARARSEFSVARMAERTLAVYDGD
jgi:glycosyltransferase involved in cell wall biosynthesis